MVLPTLSSVGEFVAWEELQEQKYEFVDGDISLFPGGTNRHMTIALNIAIALRLSGLPPGSILLEMKTVTPRSSRYPDLLVTLDERDRPAQNVTRYPILVIEVLSPSTERIDRGAKLDEYRSLDTLQEYVLVDSQQRWAQTVRRAAEEWTVSLPIVSGALALSSVGVCVPFEVIYAGTEL